MFLRRKSGLIAFRQRRLSRHLSDFLWLLAARVFSNTDNFSCFWGGVQPDKCFASRLIFKRVSQDEVDADGGEAGESIDDHMVGWVETWVGGVNVLALLWSSKEYSGPTCVSVLCQSRNSISQNANVPSWLIRLRTNVKTFKKSKSVNVNAGLIKSKLIGSITKDGEIYILSSWRQTTTEYLRL